MNRNCALLTIRALLHRALLRELLQGLLLIACSPFESIAAPAPPIAVIISAEGDRRIVAPADLVLIYQRKKLFWENGKKIYPANLPASHPLRQIFSLRVLGRQPEAMQEYWNDMYFHGTLPPYVLSSEAAVQQFVVHTPGAIGYVAYCNLDRDKRIAVALVVANGQIAEAPSDLSCSP